MFISPASLKNVLINQPCIIACRNMADLRVENLSLIEPRLSTYATVNCAEVPFPGCFGFHSRDESLSHRDFSA